MNKAISKITVVVIMFCTLVYALQPVTVNAATWKENSKGWWYEREDGTYPANTWEKIDGKWYYFDQNGYMHKGWLLENGVWYYLGKNGSMQTGWQQVDGLYYYFYESGRMAADTIVGGQYYVNAWGAWEPNATKGKWIFSYNKWWYRHADGSYSRNAWEKIDGKWYYFDNQGYMCTGWMKDGGDWYYLAADGAMVSEKWVGNYYLKASGAMATNQWIDDIYYVDDTGVWVTDAYKVDLGAGEYTTVRGTYIIEFEKEVIRLVNEYRIANGLNALGTSGYLSQQTDIRGYEIETSFSHERPNGTMCFSVIEDNRYRAMGENIAAGYRTPEEVFEGWKNSPGHNANMLGEQFTLIGVSCFYSKGSSYGYYWVQLFATE